MSAMRENELARIEFRSMGTTVKLIGPSEKRFGRASAAVRHIFNRLDDRFTRFRIDSELSAVNENAGRWTVVSDEFEELTRLALAAAERSGGLFDPTILPALLAFGYDRDFDEIIAGARLALHPPEPCARWGDVRLRRRSILLPVGASLDFGGIAKGWAVDLAAERAGELLSWCLVDAGGDLRIAGAIPSGGLHVAVEHPEDPSVELVRVRLGHGALATSSITVRTWGPGMHHLIDPRTGAPADTGVTQATVWAPSCAEAEVGSKVALLLGEEALDRYPSIVAFADGRVVVTMDVEKETAC
jgi:thiamine biosynthesis lipoprotein